MFIDMLCNRSVKRPVKVHSLEFIRSHFLPRYQALTVAEEQRAETASAMVGIVQAECFSEEIKMLRAQEVIGLPSNKSLAVNSS